MKIFITRIIPESGLQLLRNAGIDIELWEEKKELSQAQLIEFCRGCDGLLSAGPNKLDAFFLDQCSHLKVIALHSVGFDNVDISEATRLKIPVGNTPRVLSGPTADVAFLLMLAASRKAFFLHEKIKKGEWTFFEPTANLGINLYSKTLGIFGLGSIGFEMAKRCKGAYDMKIIYHNRHPNSLAEKQLNAELVSFERLLRESDVLSVHSNLSSETKNKFDKTAFQQMKKSAIFINTARGGIHNEHDLIDAIEKKNIWGAGLDVTNPEPMDNNSPLLSMPTVAVLPHIGSATMETRAAMAKMAAENIIAGLNGKPLPYPVNPEIYSKA